MKEPWWIALIEAGVIVNVVLVMFAYLTLIERKMMGRMQLRYGPNRAGPFGLLQPIADLVKLVRKEAFSPSSACRSCSSSARRPRSRCRALTRALWASQRAIRSRCRRTARRSS